MRRLVMDGNHLRIQSFQKSIWQNKLKRKVKVKKKEVQIKAKKNDCEFGDDWEKTFIHGVGSN